MSRLPGEILRKGCFFLVIDLCILEGYSLCKVCNKDISKAITASSIRFGQLIEDGE